MAPASEGRWGRIAAGEIRISDILPCSLCRLIATLSLLEARCLLGDGIVARASSMSTTKRQMYSRRIVEEGQAKISRASKITN
jgi:hypothetical protein